MVFLKDCFGQEWTEKLKTGLDKNLKSLSSDRRVWDRDDEGRSCFYDSQVRQDIAEYKEFTLKSPCG